LLSLCVFITLEAIPRFIEASTTPIHATGSDHTGSNSKACAPGDFACATNSLIFIYVAAAGLAVNTIGTLAFACKKFLFTTKEVN
jgi:hypothetical protein